MGKKQEMFLSDNNSGSRGNGARVTFNPVKLGIYAAVFIIIAIALNAFWPWRSVPVGHAGVITQFGAIQKITRDGLTTVAPWQQLNIFNIRAETADVQKAEGSTADTQPVDVAMTVRYSIQPNKVGEVFEKYSRDGDLSSFVQTATQEVFKAVTARYTAPDLIAKRTDVSRDVFSALNTKLSIYGAQVINIDMTNFTFGKDYMAAINDKVTQEQKRLAAENQLKTVEAQQKQKVAIADAEANAVKAKADGDAYATLKNAEAAANALKLKNAAIASSKDVLVLEQINVERIKAERWDGKLPSGNVYGGSSPQMYMSLPGPLTK